MFKRDRQTPTLISSEDLATFGRHKFLRPEGVEFSDSFALVKPLVDVCYPIGGDGYRKALAERHRHADVGDWEKVGAWKFVREFLEADPETLPLIDAGLLAVQRMQVTNLRMCLPLIDVDRYEVVTSGPVPHDGFTGPATFASVAGPSKQHFLDAAVADAAARRIARLPSQPGVVPLSLEDLPVRCWNLGLLIYRGALLVAPEIRDEHEVVAPITARAEQTDHSLFADALAATVLNSSRLDGGLPWPALGAARFIEDYLDPVAIDTHGYRVLLEAAIARLVVSGALGHDVSPDVLTAVQQDQLRHSQEYARKNPASRW